MRIQIQAPLHPTEREEAVKAAVTAFLPDARVEVADGVVLATSGDATALRKRIWEQRIIDTVRGALLGTADGAHARLRLNKQAAANKRLSLPAAPHALGEVAITFQVEDHDPWPDAQAFAWWLCPETRDGEIVGPVD